MAVKYGEWFRIHQTDMRWLANSPVNRTARCDRAWQHIVGPDEPRLQVDTGKGPNRKRGHGKRHEYLCAGCALRFVGTTPPAREVPGQEALFDGD